MLRISQLARSSYFTSVPSLRRYNSNVPSDLEKKVNEISDQLKQLQIQGTLDRQNQREKETAILSRMKFLEGREKAYTSKEETRSILRWSMFICAVLGLGVFGASSKKREEIPSNPKITKSFPEDPASSL